MNALEATKILASGIDTLVLAVDVDWKNRTLFDQLKEGKEKAKSKDRDIPMVMVGMDKNDKWVYMIRPFGAKGYEWILMGKEFTFRVGNWMESGIRPSVMVEIGSETLWREGPLNTCERVMRLIEGNDGVIKNVKVSRADLCVDMMFDEEKWTRDIEDYIVTKANKWDAWSNHRGLESLYVGTGKIRARLYDKPLQIKEISKKKWMYKIWGVEEVEEGKKIIRVEFQIRREVLKELGAGSLNEFFGKCDQVWSYCTRRWLKFRDRPGKRSNQRKTFDWWKVIQNGFLGVQDARPAIREKTIKEDAEQLKNQIVGFASSLTALKLEEYEFEIEEDPTFNDCISSVMDYYQYKGNEIKDFTELVRAKRAKYSRSRKKEHE